MAPPRLLSRRRCVLLLCLISNGLGQAGAAMATAFLIHTAFDHLISRRQPSDPALVWWVAGGLIAATVATAWLRGRERRDAERLGQAYVYRVRVRVFERLSALSPAALRRRTRGGIMLRFVGDLTALRQWVSLGLARLIVSGTITVGILAALAYINPVLALTVGLPLAAGSALTLRAGRSLRGAVGTARRRNAQLAANVNEKITAMAVVQAFGQSDRERRRVVRQSRRLREAMVARARLGGRLRATTELACGVAVGGVLLLGAQEVAAGRTTHGGVVAAMTVVRFLASRLRELSRVHEYWQGACVSRRKITDFLASGAIVSEAADAVDLHVQGGRLEIRDVSVAAALRQVSVVAEARTVVALVGPTGAGKSTLLSLVARLSEPDRGAVLLDGQDLTCCTLGSLRRAVGMVSPDLPLLRGSIEKNLRYRWPKAPAEEIAHVVDLCGVAQWVQELPDGLATRVQEGGLNLSSGQRQRIALARALLGRPVLLLLDETDANLDAAACALLDRVLAAHRGTVIMTTHRVERVAAADVVWHLHEGRLVEVGPPAELLRGDGPTARLFRRQLATAS